MAPTVSKSIDEAAAHITRGGHSWSNELGAPGAAITFAFRSTGTGSERSDSFSAFNDDQIAAAEEVLQLWSDVANISFTRVNEDGLSNNATILFANYNDPDHEASAYAHHPHPGATASNNNDGDVWVNL